MVVSHISIGKPCVASSGQGFIFESHISATDNEDGSAVTLSCLF